MHDHNSILCMITSYYWIDFQLWSSQLFINDISDTNNDCDHLNKPPLPPWNSWSKHGHFWISIVFKGDSANRNWSNTKKCLYPRSCLRKWFASTRSVVSSARSCECSTTSSSSLSWTIRAAWTRSSRIRRWTMEASGQPGGMSYKSLWGYRSSWCQCSLKMAAAMSISWTGNLFMVFHSRLWKRTILIKIQNN